jgi:hypothetical protein
VDRRIGLSEVRNSTRQVLTGLHFLSGAEISKRSNTSSLGRTHFWQWHNQYELNNHHMNTKQKKIHNEFELYDPNPMQQEMW